MHLFHIFFPPESIILPLFPLYSAVNIGHLETMHYLLKCWEAFSCTVCKVSMDGGPTDVNAVNLHFVANWFYALSCAMVHSNHCWPSISKFQKPLKNHWNQWLDPPKTFNGDGPKVLKPLKNHHSQWWPEKKTLTIPSLPKIDHCRGLSLLFSYCILSPQNSRD